MAAFPSKFLNSLSIGIQEAEMPQLPNRRKSRFSFLSRFIHENCWSVNNLELVFLRLTWSESLMMPKDVEKNIRNWTHILHTVSSQKVNEQWRSSRAIGRWISSFIRTVCPERWTFSPRSWPSWKKITFMICRLIESWSPDLFNIDRSDCSPKYFKGQIDGLIFQSTFPVVVGQCRPLWDWFSSLIENKTRKRQSFLWTCNSSIRLQRQIWPSLKLTTS